MAVHSGPGGLLTSLYQDLSMVILQGPAKSHLRSFFHSFIHCLPTLSFPDYADCSSTAELLLR